MYYLCCVERTITITETTMITQVIKPSYLAKVTQVTNLTTRIDAVRITDDKYIIVFLQYSSCTRGFHKEVIKNYGSKFNGFSPISQAQFKALCNKQVSI